MKYKNLLVLGASGGIGRWVVKLAKEKGYNVTVVVRSAESLKEIGGINIIQGSVLDAKVLDEAMRGQDAIISCLGIKRKKQTNPWSELASPTNFAETVMKDTVALMNNHDLQRLVVVSSAGVGDSWGTLSPFLKSLIRFSKVRYTLNDFDRMEKVLRESDVDSLAVRPVTLVDGKPENQVRIVDRFNMSSKITKGDVALWMLNALERESIDIATEEMIG